METKNFKKIIGFVALITTCACSSYAPYSTQGNISIQADEKGMRAFSDMINGTIAEGKASPNQKGAYFGMRASQEMTLQQELQRRFENE